jgi:D-psicose/D-tagatose/L-ribulose 3-epimerase
MRIGICTGLENMEKAAAIGFDYIECTVVGITSLSEEDYAKVKAQVTASPIKCEAFNVFFPGHLKIVGPEVDTPAVLAHIRMAIERIAGLGAKVAVVGSGGARRVPECWSMEKGLEQFAQVLKMIGEQAALYGITIAVEPLNRQETNIVNSVMEGAALVRSVGHSHVKLLADFYHMRKESEAMDGILEAGSLLKHLHIANSNGRVYPLNSSEDEYASFFQCLKTVGYQDRLSIEAGTNNFDVEAPAALKLLRELSI